MKLSQYILFVSLVAIGMMACSPSGGNKTGHEYMPDMAHSIAYEANVNTYYSYHIWGSKAEHREFSIPRLPVKGTIARGYAGLDQTNQPGDNGITTTQNGHVNYYYQDTEDERTRASNEILVNPFPLTAKALENGKSNYTIYCAICHGDKGDGAGYLVRDDGGKYPAQPANFLKDDFIASSEGRYYHGIMYGKNVMSGYADKLNYEERWEVIHYIRSLQAGSKSLKYSPEENTFTNSQVLSDLRKAYNLVGIAR
ncbi:MAG: cytochrome c [Saprospiraceae bacterium]|nr:cytochrome c [Saprospiraceae bacterium]